MYGSMYGLVWVYGILYAFFDDLRYLLQSLFDKWNTDGDDVITQDEFIQALAAATPEQAK